MRWNEEGNVDRGEEERVQQGAGDEWKTRAVDEDQTMNDGGSLGLWMVVTFAAGVNQL